MKIFANVTKLPNGRYISQLKMIAHGKPSVLATTPFPRLQRNYAAQDGFALKSQLTTQLAAPEPDIGSFDEYTGPATLRFG